MSAPALLRRAGPADVPALVELFLETRRVSMPYVPNIRTRDETVAWMGAVVLRDFEVWVAEEAGRLVGFLAIQGPHIEYLYVAPGRQGHGLGRALLAKAKELSPGFLELIMFADNAQAAAFYAKHGFATAGHLIVPEEEIPGFRLEWRPR